MAIGLLTGRSPWTKAGPRSSWFDERLEADDDALAAALRASDDAGRPSIAAANRGTLSHLLAAMTQPRAMLEVGPLGGDSAIRLGRAPKPGGRLVTLELDERHASVAPANLRRAGSSRVSRAASNRPPSRCDD